MLEIAKKFRLLPNDGHPRPSFGVRVTPKQMEFDQRDIGRAGTESGPYSDQV
jgi:hypothetical protein